jgi:hypothetical protein
MPKPMPNMEGRTHGIGGYNYGCRCDVCRDAKAVKRKEYQSSEAWLKAKSYRERIKQENPEQFEKLKKQNNQYKKNAHLRNPQKARWETIYKKYGMTQAMYEGLYEQQNGVCAICENKPNRNYLSVDHDHNCCDSTHTCGECIRGLLCAACNSFLGRVKDNPKKLLEYLDKYSSGGDANA